MSNQRLCFVITGPTGVGKTDFIDQLTQELPIEVVNADIGQMYTPLTIGTAKPNLDRVTCPHHLFNILSKPRSCSVAEYRRWVHQCLEGIWQRGRYPVIVGGSLFYIKSLYFPPHEMPEAHDAKVRGEVSWEALYQIDPERAHAIHPHDTYRIRRALSIWYTTGTKPSQFMPQFQPIGSSIITFLDRNRSELFSRIDARTHAMLEGGWIEETKQLSEEWRLFVKKKHIIGYPDIITYLNDEITYNELVARIQSKTRAYAKRQITLWRSLQRHVTRGYVEHAEHGYIMRLSLSDAPEAEHVRTILDLYHQYRARAL